MLQITDTIMIDESELEEVFIRSSGPGGQNINKVSTAIQLRFNAANSPSLPEAIRERLVSLARNQITEDGVVMITARRFRTQGRNRQDALERLTALIREAAELPKPRRMTRPTAPSRKRRLEDKHQRAETKRLRQPVQSHDE
jgi:ribosome-associated protein